MIRWLRERCPRARSSCGREGAHYRSPFERRIVDVGVDDDPDCGQLLANPCSDIGGPLLVLIRWCQANAMRNAGFFPSISAPAIAGVLERSGLDPDIEGLTLRVLDRLRRLGRCSVASGAGLPVCPGDFFWLVADRVLLNVDTALDRASHVLGHTRWSDDFLLSARPGAEGAALRRLATCADENGFRLNARKTRVFSSWEDYQTRNLASEHESVNDLIAVHRKGGRSRKSRCFWRP